MKKYSIFQYGVLFSVVFGIQIPLTGLCQVKIKGPACVVSKNIYSYQFIGDSVNIANVFKVCLDGGTIYPANTICVEAGDSTNKFIAYAYVRWNDSLAAGSITATDSSGLLSFRVTIVPQMIGGKLDSTTAIQSIPYNSSPASILCSNATGGNCSPSYYYWWEQSPDNIDWTKIPGAEDQDLLLNTKFTKTTYFRRGVTETKGNSTTYSSVAIVFVDPDLSGH